MGTVARAAHQDALRALHPPRHSRDARQHVRSVGYSRARRTAAAAAFAQSHNQAGVRRGDACGDRLAGSHGRKPAQTADSDQVCREDHQESSGRRLRRVGDQQLRSIQAAEDATKGRRVFPQCAVGRRV